MEVTVAFDIFSFFLLAIPVVQNININMSLYNKLEKGRALSCKPFRESTQVYSDILYLSYQCL